jgi:hypothetical protein
MAVRLGQNTHVRWALAAPFDLNVNETEREAAEVAWTPEDIAHRAADRLPHPRTLWGRDSAMNTTGALQPRSYDSRPRAHGSSAAQAAAPQTGDGPLFQQGTVQ